MPLLPEKPLLLLPTFRAVGFDCLCKFDALFDYTALLSQSCDLTPRSHRHRRYSLSVEGLLDDCLISSLSSLGRVSDIIYSVVLSVGC